MHIACPVWNYRAAAWLGVLTFSVQFPAALSRVHGRSNKAPLRNFARMGNHSKRVQSALCTRMRIVFFAIQLEPKTSECEKHVTVVSSVTGCDVTYCATSLHGFNKHASSRRAAVSDSRGVPRCTEKISKKKKSTLAHMCRSFDLSNSPYPYPVTRIVTRRHCTTCQVSSSQSALSPCQASISICGIVHVPVLSSRYHSDSHQS